MVTTESVVVIRFPQESQAYQAISELGAPEGSLTSPEVRSAALVQRRSDGSLYIPERDDAFIGAGATAGGVIGTLAGVLGGPLGVLLGFGTGVLLGGLFDVDRSSNVDGALTHLSAQIPPGSTALIVEVAETSPEPLDQFAAKFNATVERQPAAQVAAEVEAAAAAAEAAQKEANRVLRERKRTEMKASIDEKVDAVKDKLHIG